MDFERQYQRYQSLVEGWLHTALPLPDEEWPAEGMPKRLVEAMRYSLLSGGKRLRPVLLLAAFEPFNGKLEDALPFAGAVELIHTYSLVHDDLPAMDDDDLRRGKPTSHRAFGEAMAILAGDAMLTLAFEWMSAGSQPNALKAIREISRRAGASGMVAGQTADILMGGQPADDNMLRYIHQHKTADLIIAPLVAGVLLGGADAHVENAAAAYGTHLGLAFQITDDLLDARGNPELTGKAGQRDAAMGKLTWPAVVGLEQAERDARDSARQAADLSDAFGRNAGFFRSLALSIPERVK